MVRIAINGFGRIGRMAFRAAMERADVQVVAVNDLLEPPQLAYLLRHDSVHGRFRHDVALKDGALVVDGRPIRITAVKDPAASAWGDAGADVVIESTGIFLTKDKTEAHLRAGARRVIISAPTKDDTPVFVYGVNSDRYAGEPIISAASCTTNCLAPIAKVLHEQFGLKKGWMTTVHSYTNDQQLLDLPHKDLRRARAAALSLIPTTTGAASAVGEVLPALKGKLDGISVRVPTPNVSMVDLCAILEKPATDKEVNAAFEAAAQGAYKGIIEYVTAPLVSVDFRGNPHSAMLDAPYTKVLDNDFVKILAWYDNEWGYSSRCVDLLRYMAKKGF